LSRQTRALALLLSAAWACWLTPVLAQGRGGSGGRGEARPEPGRSAAADSLGLRGHDFAALAVSAHPWSTLVAVTVAIPGGSSEDPRELAGSTWLLGQAVRESLDAPLARVGATVSVSVDRNATTFQMLAAPGAWRGAYETLIDGIFEAPLGFTSLDRSRAELEGLFRFERGAPVREFQSELASLVTGSGSPWSHDPRGTSESVQRIAAPELSTLRRRTHSRGGAVVTIVGALDAAPGILLYPGAAGDGGALVGRRAGGSGSAWSRGERRRLARPVTNTWIGAAFPAREDVSPTVLEFLSDRLREELNPTPRDPGLFGAEVRVEELPDGPVILVEAAVLPEDQVRWEERILRTVRALEERYREPSFFTLHRRHFLNRTLVRESAPEVEGIRIAMDLLREGRARDLLAEIDGLNAEQVLRALESLGDPRILVFGPDLGR
jgi:hypothetical protein